MANKNIEINDNTSKVIDLLEKAKVNGLNMIGLAAEGYAKRATPVDTGRLRNSITYAIAGKPAHVKSYSASKKSKAEKKSKSEKQRYTYNGVADGKTNSAVYIGTNVEYAEFIENGAKGRIAHHMLKNAATQHSDKYRKLMEKALKG